MNQKQWFKLFLIFVRQRKMCFFQFKGCIDVKADWATCYPGPPGFTSIQVESVGSWRFFSKKHFSGTPRGVIYHFFRKFLVSLYYYDVRWFVSYKIDFGRFFNFFAKLSINQLIAQISSFCTRFKSSSWPHLVFSYPP